MVASTLLPHHNRDDDEEAPISHNIEFGRINF